MWSDSAQIGYLPTSNPPMLLDILQYPLLLLERLEASLAHVTGLVTKRSISCRREMPAPPPILPPLFDQTGFDQTMKRTPRFGVGLLRERDCHFLGQTPFLPEGVENQQIIEAEYSAALRLGDEEAYEVEVGFTAGN
jgi:hypothetical protein